DPLVVLEDVAVLLEPGRILVRQLLDTDALGHRPGRLRDQSHDRCLQLWRRLVRLPFDDIAAVDMLAVAPIIEDRPGRVDVDAGAGRIARKPPQTLHSDG